MMHNPFSPFQSHSHLGRTDLYGSPILKVFSLLNQFTMSLSLISLIRKKLWRAKLLERPKMFIWRIGANAIPTKANLKHRIQHINSSSILCDFEEENSIHIFFHCHFARALWAITCWGLRIDTTSITSSEDIIKLITNPPNTLIPAQDLWTITLNMAIIIDEIWKTRNHILFQEGKADLAKAKLNMVARFLEISKEYSPITHPSSDPFSTSWFPLPPDCIKINVDVVLNSSKFALAVVARNHHGDVLFMWGKQHHLCTPSQAKASPL